MAAHQPPCKKYQVPGRGVCYNEEDFIEYLNKWKYPDQPSTLVENLGKLSDGKAALVPADGTLLERTVLTFEPGESVFDVFSRCLREQGIHFEYVDAKAYGTAYIEGIGNLYEFDCGEQSGWLFFVNGISPGMGCSAYPVADGDEIVFAYTCDFGADLGIEEISK